MILRLAMAACVSLAPVARLRGQDVQPRPYELATWDERIRDVGSKVED